MIFGVVAIFGSSSTFVRPCLNSKTYQYKVENGETDSFNTLNILNGFQKQNKKQYSVLPIVENTHTCRIQMAFKQ